MNPVFAIGALVFALGVIGGCIVSWGIGPASQRADEQLADVDLADAVQNPDQPVPFLPVPFPTTEQDQDWLHTIGVQP